MTKLLTWRDEWALGIDALDADHRALIGTVIDICLRFCPQAAIPSGVSAGVAPPRTAGFPGASQRDLVEALVAFGGQVHAHFRREESFMRAIGYARAEQHAAEHVVLMSQFSEMLRNWRALGITVFDEAAQERVCQWLLTHILESDRAFAKDYFALCGWPESDADPA